ncbi:toll/interleukin-1 receptor domain-containing protein [Halobacillus kuroshimensis]|uniref:toll/interleukin-1 receptor domain-containing protein n=1 Tax=Halobacillus kuroshimensis TaxID=302481 RepID=UPI000400D238|nr:toll/interleukin-1 receptor domain-containing protein [Halobacillus kuroshimensis]
MSIDNKKVFISYSWDDKSHEQWVMDLVVELRNNGVDASFDKYVTQSKTTNLYQMMINNMRNNDNVIIVLTEKFAKKADEIQGGVGFETLLSLPDIQEDPNRFIFILKHQGNFKEAFPFHLRGYYAIDFSEDEFFDEKFLELLHRIEGVPMYEKVPLGKKRDLKPIREIDSPSKNEKDFFKNIELPNSREVRDIDKDRFLSESYEEIQNLFVALFNHLKEELSSFEYVTEQISNKKHIFKLYVNGQQKIGIKIWLGGHFGNGINLSYDNHIDPYSDNSMNETIRCEVNNRNEMKLSMTMNMFGNKEVSDPRSIVQEIWRNNLSHYIK